MVKSTGFVRDNLKNSVNYNGACSSIDQIDRTHYRRLTKLYCWFTIWLCIHQQANIFILLPTQSTYGLLSRYCTRNSGIHCHHRTAQAVSFHYYRVALWKVEVVLLVTVSIVADWIDLLWSIQSSSTQRP